MAIQELPAAPDPATDTREAFGQKAAAFVLAQKAMVPQLNQAITTINANTETATAAAATAVTKAAAAASSADAAGQAASDAAGSASTASTRASDAANSATAAANSAAGMRATSTTSNTLTTGAKTFAVQAGRQFAAGTPVRAVSPTDSTKFVSGTVTSYSGTSLVIDATLAGGSGTLTSWNLAIIGERGADGPAGSLTGGNLTGPLNDAKGANIASAATINLTAATGGFVHVTGTTAISAITLQVGAERTVVFDGALTLTHGSGLLLPGSANIVTAANDRMTVRGDANGAIVTHYTRANGNPAGFSNMVVLRSTQAWSPPAGVTKAKFAVVDGGYSGAKNSDSGTGSPAVGGRGGNASVSIRAVSSSVTYTCTIGAGGLASTSTAAAPSVAGGASSVSGAGLTTLTSTNGDIVSYGGQPNGNVLTYGGASLLSPGQGGIGAGGQGGPAAGGPGNNGADGGIVIEY